MSMSGISLQNRLAIHELIANYSYQVDNYHGEEWAGLFVEGGKLLGKDYEFTAPDGFVRQARWLKKQPMEYRHHITNIFLEDDASNDHAVANAYGLVTDWAQAPVKIDMFVEYRFELVNRDGRWLIAQLRVHTPYED